jgi:uncharacterized membrane protein
MNRTRFKKASTILGIVCTMLLPCFADSIPLLPIDTALADTVAVDSTITVSITEPVPPTPLEEALDNDYLMYFAFLLLFALVLAWVFSGFRKIMEPEGEKTMPDLFVDKLRELKSEASNLVMVTLILVGLGLVFYFTYYYVLDTPMESHLTEWLNLLVRWAHVVAGILWIGASFYFIFLENSLNRNKDLKEDIAGNLWAIHGGGFYYLEKYKLAPKKIPRELHWFKYEAYFTWITGFALLWIVYYMNASVYMVDPEVMDIDPGYAVIIGLASLLVSWITYDLLCESKIAKNPLLFALVGFALITLISWGLCQVLSGRAAFIHVGAIIGTLMVGNVFRVIIPSQKALVNAAKEGKPLDPSLGLNAGLRSLHNNYFTLPVIFIMISNHFPSTFGNNINWVVLAGLSLTSAVIKHYWNLLERGRNAVWILPVAAVGLLALVIVTAPRSHKEMLENADPVTYSEIQAIFEDRCVSCHSQNPIDDIWKVAPNGVMFDTPEQIVKLKDKILNRVVTTKTMPQANKSGMKQKERDLVEIWLYQGAKTD